MLLQLFVAYHPTRELHLNQTRKDIYVLWATLLEHNSQYTSQLLTWAPIYFDVKT